ncbi:hypothetical protein DFH08DRAFT_959553 [Mycena albidolilacea]|uniref:Uncharacterized protein n=1 Tax=Mycena albidolilacea TaxID=1033008 RepID=A0AAD7A4M4_9AGAR|nr:hypothetical protein DFH08DRAFT_959553 [Mycena albidolilacea]
MSSQQSGITRISREMSTDSLNEHIARLQDEIEEHRESIFVGMSREAVERANDDPEYLRYLHDLIELEGEADTEVVVADANLRTAQNNMMEASTRRDQIAELHQHFERGDVEPTHFVDAVDLLCCQVSPDADDVPDEKMDSGDESEGGEETGAPEDPEELVEVGKKRKNKGKAKAAPKKARKEHEERDGSSVDCEKCIRCNIPCVVLPGKTACDGCHKLHVKCSLRLQSTTCLPQVKGPRIAEAMAELGQEDAVRRLQELEQREKECKQKKQRKRVARAARAAGKQPQEDVGPPRSETSARRTGRSLLCATRPSSHVARSRSHTGFALLSLDGPVVPLVDESSLIQMTIKQEHQDANIAALDAITQWSLEWAARKAERRERVAREEAERAAEKERKKAELEAELQALMAKKAALEETPVEPKTEPVEETAVSVDCLNNFVVPIGFHMEGQFLVQDDEVPEATKNIEYNLEYAGV